MEKFILLGSGVTLMGLSTKLSLDFPPANILFAPMTAIGCLVSVLGTAKAIPMLEVRRGTKETTNPCPLHLHTPSL